MQNQVSQQESLKQVAGNNIQQFLTFVLNNEVYGVNILSIKEIIDYGNITRVPMVNSFIAGVINLRGSVVPIIDLALRFSTPPSVRTKRSSIVIIELKHNEQNMEIGITVDEVNEVINIAFNEIETTPEFGTKIRTDFIAGMGKVEDHLLILLDIENILAIDELSLI
ncbi:MAG: purine-binding chemotaxis protein CheW [Alteromonadaceae bacterium]|jgi:purine-binding chemotaxis protein CheW